MSASDNPTRGSYGHETMRMPRVAEPASAESAPPPSSAPVTSAPAKAPIRSMPAAPPPPAGLQQRQAPVQSVPQRARKARLVLTRIDPWSVMKLSFLLSIALGIITVVAVVVLWKILDSMGVFTSVSDTYRDLTSTDQSAGFDLLQYVAFNRVVGAAAILALVNVVLITALATLSAFLYNVTSALVGGLHVTLSDDLG